MSAIVRGIFPVLQTAANDDGGPAVVNLRKQVDFCIQAGAHGLVVDAIFPRAYPGNFFDLAAILPELTNHRHRAHRPGLHRWRRPRPAWVENMQYAAEFPSPSSRTSP